MALILVAFSSAPSHAVLPYLASETAVPVERGKSRLDLSFGQERWADLNPEQTRYAIIAELSYGLINNLEFSVQVPYLFNKVEGYRNEDGLGDLTLKAKIRFIKGREANPVSIAGQVSMKFPSCDDSKALSQDCTGEPDLAVRAIASKEFFPVTVHLNLGYIYVGNPPGVQLDDVFTYSLGLDYLTVADYFHVIGELAGESNRYPKTGNSPLSPGTSSNPLSALVGLMYEIDVDKILTLAGSVGVTNASPDHT
ncbi:MAG TPA: hypothetical protein VI702_01075, partial [Nitrospiria bacterium]